MFLACSATRRGASSDNRLVLDRFEQSLVAAESNAPAADRAPNPCPAWTASAPTWNFLI
jgi:hypothetical protein